MFPVTDFSNLLEGADHKSWLDRHAAFEQRAEVLVAPDPLEENQVSRSLNTQEAKIEILESLLVDEQVRLTATIQVDAESGFSFGEYTNGCELLLVSGDLTSLTADATLALCRGSYLRIPAGQTLEFRSTEGCSLLIKLGQMSETDEELRNINTDNEELWLPGPVEGTQVFPLHLHDTKNVFLIRWNEPAWFKPQLNPLGEELLVVSGTLHDAFGSYEKGSWIRNPVPAWQAWGGYAGTVVYYKNGHFPEVLR